MLLLGLLSFVLVLFGLCQARAIFQKFVQENSPCEVPVARSQREEIEGVSLKPLSLSPALSSSLARLSMSLGSLSAPSQRLAQ